MRSARTWRVVSAGAAVTLALLLVACNERDQALNAEVGASAARADGQPWQGTQNGFMVPGYQAGDKARWQTQLRQRAQTQNEYVKTN